MKQVICVYDFETDGPDPRVCEPVQLAACIIHNVTLEIVPDSDFMICMRPPDIDGKTYYEDHKLTIEWHAKNYEITPEEIFERWKAYPNQKDGWSHFLSYLDRHNKNQSRKSKWTAPVRAGANVRNFDNIIIDRLAARYRNVDKDGSQNIFYPRDVIDIVEMSFYWFESLPETSAPAAYNMDALRQFFGISSIGSHDALKDIHDEAWLIQRFMRLFRRQAPKVTFKGTTVEPY